MMRRHEKTLCHFSPLWPSTSLPPSPRAFPVPLLHLPLHLPPTLPPSLQVHIRVLRCVYSFHDKIESTSSVTYSVCVLVRLHVCV